MKRRGTVLGYALLFWGISLFFFAQGESIAASKFSLTSFMGNVVGISANVPPNEHNSLAQQFEEKAKELDLREEALSAREQALLSELDERQRGRESRLYGYIFALATVLLFLVGANYYFDYQRATRHPELS